MKGTKVKTIAADEHINTPIIAGKKINLKPKARCADWADGVSSGWRT
jgi:hypothetical protein